MNVPLVEIVGSTRGSDSPRGLVLCGSSDSEDGWTLVAVVADTAQPAPELRFFPNGGLRRVAALDEGYLLQVTTRDRAEAEQGDLLALMRMLPDAVETLDGPNEVLEADEVIALDELEEDTALMEIGAVQAVLSWVTRFTARASALLRALFPGMPEAVVLPPTPRPRRAGPVSVELLAVPLPIVTQRELLLPTSER
jgi:hypothetical protein